MTVATFLTNLLRPAIRDETATYRWSDDNLLAYVNAGRRWLYGKHPEAFYVTTILVAEPSALAATSATLDVIEYFVDVMTHYCAVQVLAEDGDDSANLPLLHEHQAMLRELAP